VKHILIKSSTNFTINGISNQELKLIHCNINTGMQEEPFIYSREIELTYIKGRDNPYLAHKKPSVLKFNATFAFENTFTSDDLRLLARTIDSQYFIPLTFIDESSDNTSITKLYYVILDGDPIISHNCINQGYVTLSFICDSPYCYSPVYQSNVYDMSENILWTDIIFNNKGDMDCKPEIYITKVGNGDFVIQNLSDNNIQFKFTDLIDQEEISVSNENEIINTNLSIYRYDNFNFNFLSIPPGLNTLRILGNVKFYFKYQFKYY